MENQVAEPEVNTDQLRADILKDVKGEAPSGKKPWEVRMEQDHPEMAEPAKKEEAEEIVKEKETPKEEPKREEQPAETESAPVEEQPEEEAQPASNEKDTANKEDAYIAEYAKSNNLTVDDAKDEVAKLKAITAKYGNDPV